MSGPEIFHGFFKKGDFTNLTLLSVLTWFISTIIFKLFGIDSTTIKIIVPLLTALLISWVRENKHKNDHHRKYVFRIIANGCILFFGAVMTSKTFYTLGKLPTIEFAVMPNKGDLPIHQPDLPTLTGEHAIAYPTSTNTFEFWYARKHTSALKEETPPPRENLKNEDRK